MRRYLVTWQQEEERKPGKRPAVRTFEDVMWSARLAGAVEAWGRKGFCNAEIVAVRLVENGRASATPERRAGE